MVIILDMTETDPICISRFVAACRHQTPPSPPPLPSRPMTISELVANRALERMLDDVRGPHAADGLTRLMNRLSSELLRFLHARADESDELTKTGRKRGDPLYVAYSKGRLAFTAHVLYGEVRVAASERSNADKRKIMTATMHYPT